jgi:predicted SAM-dependent methyltransferase
LIKRFFKKFPKFYSFFNTLLLKIFRCIKSLKVKYQIKLKNNNLKIVIGASGKYSEGWIPTEIDFFNILDKKSWDYFFNDESIDAILAEHVWEHLTLEDGLKAARYCYKYIKQGGYIRLAVPDGYHPDNDYINMVKPGGSGEGSEDHKVLYNIESLSDLFEDAGFNISRLEYFNSAGEFHFVNWDAEKGKISRSAKYDSRNKNGDLIYTSLIVDACKNN